MNTDRLIVKPGKKFRLKSRDTADTKPFKEKKQALEKLENDLEKLRRLQDVLYADDSHSLLIILQAMDAAGKDGVIKHVMSGVNPQGCQVYSFKAPSSDEIDHTYLWRCMKKLPRRGNIGIFNRSYYEEVLITKVHPEVLNFQRIPGKKGGKQFWEDRYEDINDFEKHLVRNGVHVLKFFLNVSRSEQKKRFLARIDREEKNWKFSSSDIKERSFWNDYAKAYEEAIGKTSTAHAPWHVIPADNKWFSRLCIANIIVQKLESLKLEYPKLPKQERDRLIEARKSLMDEKS
jgi:PPK2 family polyphosphate:nucleotide phosphotransferase